LIQFDRVVAINTPVRMAQGISKLDEFYRAPLRLAGHGTDRQPRKHLSQGGRLEQSTLTPQTSLPFSAIESKFLIGLTFRLIAAGHYLQQPAAK
jgi:hypothetical protein